MNREELRKIRPLRGGGVASLILAGDRSGDLFVIRELNRELRLSWRLRRGFVHGMRIRQALSPHEHILESRGMSVHRLAPYEILDYVSGGSLQDLISQRHAEVQGHHLDILRQVSSALAHMHARGIAHLDVKAENILVHADSKAHEVHVKLTDFDLSRHLHGGWRRMRSGTASYMAPEQLTSGRVGFGNDIFAFGVLAYYLVAGRMPFAGFTLDEARYRQADIRHVAMAPRKLCPGLSIRLDEIITACLEKDPDRRFPNMGYLDQELRRI